MTRVDTVASAFQHGCCSVAFAERSAASGSECLISLISETAMKLQTADKKTSTVLNSGILNSQVLVAAVCWILLTNNSCTKMIFHCRSRKVQVTSARNHPVVVFLTHLHSGIHTPLETTYKTT